MINYIFGDLTKHNFTEKTIVPHVVNNQCINGSGVVIAIKKKWPLAIINLEQWFNDLGWVHYDDNLGLETKDIDDSGWELGQVQFSETENKNVIVANMIGQRSPGGYVLCGKVFPPINMESVEECIIRVADFCQKTGVKNIVAPKFGSLRAGGNWEDIEKLILQWWCGKGINVTVYEYKE